MAKKCKICRCSDKQLLYRTAFLSYMCDECYVSERKRVCDEKKSKGSIHTKKENMYLYRKAQRPKYYLDFQKVCAEIIRSRDYVCRGCGNANIPLDFSHTVARSQYPSLVCDPNNIELMCRSCHTIWEHGNIEQQSQLNNFRDMIKYMRFNAYPLYVKLMLKLGLQPNEIPNDPNRINN